MTCYQACRSFEIFIICLAFLLIQKVNVTAITVKSTSRELDGKSFLNCPGTFLLCRFIIVYRCSDLIHFNSNIRLELQTNIGDLKKKSWKPVKISKFVINVVNECKKNTKNALTVLANFKKKKL